MVQAIGQLPDQSAKLQLAGKFNPMSALENVKHLDGWSRVNFHGWANRGQVANILAQARAGLVVLHPTANYREAYPVKMFEYMAMGIPVIASDFPLWRRIVEDAECGLVVNPLNPDEIANAMQWLLDNPSEAEAMGDRGRKAVEANYNWESESHKLIEFYRQLSDKHTVN